MTIAAGFVVRDGVLLCADTLWSDGQTKEYRDKIFSWMGKHAVVSFAVAGNSDNARAVVDDCKAALHSSKKTKLSTADTLRIIRGILRKAWESHVDSRPWEERENAQYQFLIGISTNGQMARLFKCTATSLAAVDTFECVGNGSQLARYCIHPSYHQNMTADEAAVLGILALAATKEHVDGVGGRSQFVAVRKGFASGIVPHDVNRSEPLALEHLRRATNLLLMIADAELEAQDFKEFLLKFARYAQDARAEWSKQASPYRELRDSLSKPAQTP